MFHVTHGLAFLLIFAFVFPGWTQEKKDDPDKGKKEEFKLSADEQALIDLTNAERKNADKDLSPLKVNEKLMEAARKHAANMAAQEMLEHELDGESADDRVKAEGYKASALGENIAEGPKTPKAVLALWMDSPPHRGNILSAE